MIELLRSYVLDDGSMEVVRECRNCGTAVEPDEQECPSCGSSDIARYEIE